MLLRTIVAQEALDLLADAALVNVQVVALSSSLAAAVGIGAGAAAIRVGRMPAKRPINEGEENMFY